MMKQPAHRVLVVDDEPAICQILVDELSSQCSVTFAYDGGETFTLPADQVLKAIGQKLDATPIAQDGAKLAGHSGKVWAGGDCAAGGEDLTVTAVAQGRDAAEAINAALQG